MERTGPAAEEHVGCQSPTAMSGSLLRILSRRVIAKSSVGAVMSPGDTTAVSRTFRRARISFSSTADRPTAGMCTTGVIAGEAGG